MEPRRSMEQQRTRRPFGCNMPYRDDTTDVHRQDRVATLQSFDGSLLSCDTDLLRVHLRECVAMSYLLFPGRHHLLTNFQLEYLTLVTSADARELRDVNGRPLELADRIDTIVWAVTSANHFNTRRNPLPAYRRAAAIEEFGSQLDAESLVYMIDDIGSTPRFAEYVLKKIEVESFGRIRMTPANTVVGCSTPAVIELYERLGFRILPFELADRAAGRYAAQTPWELLTHVVETHRQGRDWRTDETYLRKVARATRRLYDKYDFGNAIIQLHQDPLLTSDGDITETRDYNTYVRSFDQGAERKYALIRGLVAPGRIVDIGCCTGSILREMTLDESLRESDFYGIEVARPLYAECVHRKELGAFANDNVFFYQRDFAAGPVFPSGSVNTFTTFSLTHELESYQGRPQLERFMRLLFDQLASGGRWINVDVIGPPDRDAEVYLWLSRADGRCDDWEREFPGKQRDALREYLDGLSTFARFQRFARDFRRDEGGQIRFEIEEITGEPYVRLRLEDACEFLSKKDYTDNWQSEMHERFCFWSFAEWKSAVERSGFRVHPSSYELLNPWIVANRYEGKVRLLRGEGDRLTPLPWPASNMVLVAEKV